MQRAVWRGERLESRWGWICNAKNIDILEFDRIIIVRATAAMGRSAQHGFDFDLPNAPLGSFSHDRDGDSAQNVRALTVFGERVFYCAARLVESEEE